MHINLTEENKDKLLHASGQLNVSVAWLVNTILKAVNEVHLQQLIKFVPKPPPTEDSSQSAKPPKKRIIVRSTWNARL